MTAARIVIAVGSTPTAPKIPGAEYAISSDQAFYLKHRPQRVCMVGGGYIGVEFAGIFRGFGSEVDLVYRQQQPLRGLMATCAMPCTTPSICAASASMPARPHRN